MDIQRCSSRPSGVSSDLSRQPRRPFFWMIVICGLLALLPPLPVHSAIHTLQSFGLELNGAGPSGALLRGTDGNFYGTTAFGGREGFGIGTGTVFRLSPDGTTLTTLIHFNGYFNGSHPYGALIQAADGQFYGTTSSGGSGGRGTIFRLSADGKALTTLVEFNGVNGAEPRAGLIWATDGNLYGTTYSGGNSDGGTVFRLRPDGTALTTLVHFNQSNGVNPAAQLLQAADGNLYGTTVAGGANNLGTAFRLNANGGAFTVLVHFNGSNGSKPRAALIQGSDGNLYGTTDRGGSNNLGTAFRLRTGLLAGLDTLVSFNGANGTEPYAALLQAADGSFYGTTFGPYGGGTVFRLRTGLMPSLTTLVRFNVANGTEPVAPLIQTADGTFYGTTGGGGPRGTGTVFRLSSDGKIFTTWSPFNGSRRPEPNGLIQAADGTFIGTTGAGGTFAAGTAYRLSADGSALTTLVNFSRTGGYNPGRLIQARDGNFYGVTPYRLVSVAGDVVPGNVFRLSADGSLLTTLYNFDSASGFPGRQLLEAADGRFYGVTPRGGSNQLGTLFRLGADGSSLNTLVTFSDWDGAYPNEALTQGADGNLYGTTYWGGKGGFGTVFRLSADGSTLTTLIHFDGTNGQGPTGKLIQARDGNFYGITSTGGLADDGTLFRFGADGGHFTTLAHFDVTKNGRNPETLMQARDGNFYGTTSMGGFHSNGTLFRLSADGSKLTTLAHFGWDNGNSNGDLIQATDGHLYGTTTSGGTFDSGTIYRYVMPSPPPATLTATAGVRSVDLGWGFVAGATRYKVYQGSTPGGQGVSPVQTVVSTGTVVSGLANGTYYFKVTSENTEGESDPSVEASALVNTPNNFLFTDVSGVTRSTTQTSAPVTIGGLIAQAPVSVAGGTYSIGCLADGFRSAPSSIGVGQSVCVRHVSSASFNAATNTTLTVGGIPDTFTSTTAGPDTQPDGFVFVDQSPVPVGTVRTSNAVTITGIDASVPISVSGGFYSIGCSTTGFTSASGSIAPNQSVCVRHTASASFGTSVHTTLSVGGVMDTFTSTTGAPAAQVTPTGLSFAAQSVGTSSAAMPVTLRNTGTANLVVGSAALGGANVGDFVKSADACSGTTLVPGATCAVSVRFAPTATGARSASLSIPSNVSGSPHAVALNGTGTPEDLDDDDDGLPDVQDPSPNDSDEDDDGIPDGKDVEFVQRAINTLPLNAFRQPRQGNRNAMLTQLDQVESSIAGGDLAGAISKLEQLRLRVNGCGSAADSNDYIENCALQRQIRDAIDLLIANLRA